MLDERGGISPFGWAVACAGRRPGQVEDEVRALVAWSAGAWKRHFPPERGYVITVDAPSGVITVDAPSGVITGDAPSGVITGDAPSGVITGDAPSGALSGASPSGAITGDSPSEVISVDSPSRRAAVESSAAPAQCVRMSARRGDFEASLAIEHGPAPRGAVSAAPSVRMFGQAQSLVARRAHELGERLVQRGRIVGGAAGLGMFISLAWLMIGVNNPIYMLGGMLLVVALLLALMAGGTLGTWVGERLAAYHRDRARREIDRNVAMHDDIRRWKAVARQLAAQRSALAHHRRQPFRSEPDALTG